LWLAILAYRSTEAPRPPDCTFAARGQPQGSSVSAYDTFRLCLHPWLWGWIFPQAKASVSNARSYRNSGFLYGFLALLWLGVFSALLSSAEGRFLSVIEVPLR